MANTRIKVSRQKLITQLSTARKKEQDKYDAAVAAFPAKKESYLAGVRDSLESFLAVLDSNPDKAFDRISTRSGYGEAPSTTVTLIKGCGTMPTVPKPPNDGRLDRMLRVLEASEDDTLSISAEDEYARFL